MATPSLCFHVEDLQQEHVNLRARGVMTTEISPHAGTDTFAFADNEDRWFAVLARP